MLPQHILLTVAGTAEKTTSFGDILLTIFSWCFGIFVIIFAVGLFLSPWIFPPEEFMGDDRFL